MQDIIPFEYQHHQVRIILDEQGDPWWVAKDVCQILEHTNHKIAVQSLDDDERKKVPVIGLAGEGVNFSYPLDHTDRAKKSLGRQGDAWVISESGLYTLIIRSNKPQAKPFRKWVTSEVLPAIRKTGSYVAPGASVESAAERKAMEYAQKIMALQDELLDVYRQHGKGKIGPSALNAPYRPPLSSKERNEICRLRDEGLGTSEIARRVGCHKSTVRGILKKAGYPAQSPFGGRVSHE